MKKYVVIAATLTAFVTPAFAAEFYLAQDPSTKKCKILEAKPADQTMVLISAEPYASREEAKAAKRAAKECRNKEGAD